mgnify:CR=1 FL=1
MEVPTEKSRLEILSIDKMTKTQADTERSQANPFESADTDSTQANTGDGDQLPF